MCRDEESIYPYVWHKEKKLYFPRWSEPQIKHAYNQLIMEQDVESPHTYFSEKYQIEEGDIFVDVGGAEGIISLFEKYSGINALINIVGCLPEDERFIFQEVDYYVTNRSIRTMYRVGQADINGVKIISGANIPMFDDEIGR